MTYGSHRWGEGDCDAVEEIDGVAARIVEESNVAGPCFLVVKSIH